MTLTPDTPLKLVTQKQKNSHRGGIKRHLKSTLMGNWLPCQCCLTTENLTIAHLSNYDWIRWEDYKHNLNWTVLCRSCHDSMDFDKSIQKVDIGRHYPLRYKNPMMVVFNHLIDHIDEVFNQILDK